MRAPQIPDNNPKRRGTCFKSREGKEVQLDQGIHHGQIHNLAQAGKRTPIYNLTLLEPFLFKQFSDI